jgi:threonine synthase
MIVDEQIMNLKDLLLKIEKYKIGDTPLIRRKKLEELCGIPNFLIKDESKNQFGTFKDRRNKLVIEKAIEEHVDKLALITSGNAGYSLARLAEGTDIKVVCIVDRTIDVNIKNHLLKHAYNVVEVDLSQKIFQPEDIMERARETRNEVIWDVTNGYHMAFHALVGEIESEDPDFLISPLGSGEAYVGLYEGLKVHGMRTKLIGVGVHGLRNNRLELHKGPSVADKLYTPWTPYKKRIEAILQEGHLYSHCSDEQISSTYRKIRRVISCEPSSAAVFAALPEMNIDKSRKVVAVNSGKGVWGS